MDMVFMNMMVLLFACEFVFDHGIQNVCCVSITYVQSGKHTAC